MEGDAGSRTRHHRIERALRESDQAHAVVDATGTESALCDLEAAAFAGDQMVERHARAVEAHFGMAVRRVVETEQMQRAHHGHAGCRLRHDDLAVAAMRFGVRTRHAHDDEEVEARVHRAGDPPFAPGDDVVVAVAFDARRDVGGVAGGHVRFGHREGRACAPHEQRLEPALLLLWRTVVMQHFHVAGIRRVAVDRLGRDQRLAAEFGQRRVVEVR